MEKKAYIKIFSPNNENKYSDFYLYLPAGKEDYAEYRFVYVKNPIKPELEYSGGPNDAANCEFYRIREAYIGKLEGEVFTRKFRALQGGEVGFAFCEKGAGDFCGGFHGDEVMTNVSLKLNGVEAALDKAYFGSFESFEFVEDSYLYRCNTPSEKLVLHKQKYTVSGNTLNLSQYIEWINDSKPFVAAYTPMLTVQRINPANTGEILTDTVEFYDKEGGELLKSFDTTSYGESLDGKFSESVCYDTLSTAVKVYGKNSGFAVEGGYKVVDGTIPDTQIDTHLCIRFARCLDNKIYFNIAKDTAAKAGTVWQSDIYYRLTYDK